MEKKELKNLLFVLLILSLVGLTIVQASFSGLLYDEAYYWIYAQNLDFGYFDHPPMVGWLIALGTLLGKHELFVRLPFIILNLIGLFLLYRLCFKDKFFFVFLCLSFPLFHGVSFLALPDGPQFFFGILYFYFLKSYLDKDDFKNIFLLALSIALLLYSKYHGVLLVFFTLLADVKIIKRKSFWLVFFLSFIFFFPHIWWQYQHDFISIKFHLFERSGSGFKFRYVRDYLLGIMILSGGFACLVYAKSLFRNAPQNEFERIIKFSAIGLFLFFFLSSFKGRAEANWTLNAYPLLIIWISNKFQRKQGLLYLSFPIILVLITVRFLLLTDSSLIKRAGEFHQWGKIYQEIDQFCDSESKLSNRYQFAAKLSFYSEEMIPAITHQSRRSHYNLLEQKSLKKSDSFCFITDKAYPESKKIMLKYRGPIYITRGFKLDSGI